MTRVSENSGTHSIQYSLNKAKKKLEDLQMKGATLSNISRPSENPIANVEALTLDAVTSDNKQYIRNADYAVLQLNMAEKSIEQLSDIVNKAKEIAIAQSSDFYDSNIRKNISMEVVQLFNQALAIANRRVGNRYIFAGHKSLTAPFNHQGDYMGDSGKINLEISKDFFVPINISGKELFFDTETVENSNPLEENNEQNKATKEADQTNREVASVNSETNNRKFVKGQNLFGLLSSFIGALENNDNKQIQNLLEKFDEAATKLITLRTGIGSTINSIKAAQTTTETDNVENSEQRSRLVDADIADLFSEITKQQQVLKTTYQSGKGMLNQSLLDFLR